MTDLRSIQNRFVRVLVAAAIALVLITGGVAVAVALNVALRLLGEYVLMAGLLTGLLIWFAFIAYTVLWGND